MIAGCPGCGARYRIERERIKPEGVRLRCKRCGAAFRVRAPASKGAAKSAPGADTAAPAPVRSRERLVVVGDANAERARGTAAALARAGLEVVVAQDGVEAVLTIQRVLPRAVVLDAALPRMYGFQICELVKRNESLRSTIVVLTGDPNEAHRYRRPPGQLYGADAYVDDGALPSAALEALRGLGVPLEAPAPPRPQPAPAPAPKPPTPSPAARDRTEQVDPLAQTVAAQKPAAFLDPATAKAERLARIIVSDIVLYNEEKFAAAVASGNVLEAMDTELEEGRALFRERVEAPLRSQRDFLRDEMLRVARARGSQS